ncbi:MULTISPECIES: sensor histidine kinase [Bacillales]|jgi:two-component system nitrate/nitrite sensor histidine kinase NarX|uniref:histidine kinase n=1 Tax=Brevibacillus aydinogluensis TaxID=927786 RepID=A0AA48MBG6_9BACL|nr:MULTISPECIES: histidine kinase [Bacillales]REK61492.1 MAG: two-component sensor histidine kinase [Brevibacillus sp.]MBR8660308.1 sensor histidine kinase [Brevibacillus sp. NL20B1]MDT3416530.1 two-component system nitrate/nitrite sensor histidine kinase NarX [Brevibacillus aydinogluensis]NNV03529.1 sensor histidine kinase [Brevibacillus sp. MCWH]UFJ60182.1 sensor histidine kinase [Anoxybacillus sediminis]
MTYRSLYWLTVLLPPFIIGGFEFVRHDFLLDYLSMEAGNVYITILTLLLSFLFATWMFRKIERMNAKLVEEQARRAVYEERERLARELHDGIAQSLFFLNVKLKQGQLEDARVAVSAIDNHVRQAIFNLRSLPEEGSSLTQRVEKWLSQWSALSGVDVTQEVQLVDGIFSPAEEVQLFGVIQEAFANIRKHANARHTWLKLVGTEPGNWQLVIEDDGIGIPSVDGEAKKYGLAMMAERARQLGAAIVIRQRAEGGTHIQLTAGNGGIGR